MMMDDVERLSCSPISTIKTIQIIYFNFESILLSPRLQTVQVGPDTELSSSELLTLSCGVLFFFSFFVAMYVEVKAEFTIYQVCSNGIIKVFYIHLSRISPYPPSIYMTNSV